MNIIVTGGEGFIGSHLVERLVKEGHKTYAIDNLSNCDGTNLLHLDNELLKIHRDDIQNERALTNIMAEPEEIDTIYHLACHPRSMSFANPKKDLDENVYTMIVLIKYAQVCGAKIIFASNSGIYKPNPLPISENNQDLPTTPYDLNKMMAEQYLKLYKVPHTIFRFATVYGPRQNLSETWRPVIHEFLNRLHNNEAGTINGTGEQTRDFIYVDDIVEALVRAGKSDASNLIMNLGTGVETSIRDLYAKCQQIASSSINPNWGPEPEGDIPRMMLDSSRASQLIDWKPKIPLEQGLKRVYDWRIAKL